VNEVVFVFGSNLAGRHGKGAALEAKKVWGAEQGVGVGRTGNAYALPTKDLHLQTLDYDDFVDHLIEFKDYAEDNPKTKFLLTAIGTGLAGMDPDFVVTMLGHLPENVYVSGKLWTYLWEKAA